MEFVEKHWQDGGPRSHFATALCGLVAKSFGALEMLSWGGGDSSVRVSKRTRVLVCCSARSQQRGRLRCCDAVALQVADRSAQGA